ncbi:hypothetical protein AGRO_5011 [Agrobacterium sp. ATCC 31749]|nr:hypothetical protein AGRO_5011 [Agrobacterium sp. ATCC 31749]
MKDLRRLISIAMMMISVVLRQIYKVAPVLQCEPGTGIIRKPV